MDLLWDVLPPPGWKVEVQRADTAAGPFRTISRHVPKIAVYSDFIGSPGKTFFYRIRLVPPGKSSGSSGGAASPSAWSNVAEGTSRLSSRDEFLTEVQRASFRYFYDYGHPVSGLAREGSHRRPGGCSMGATGMGLFNLGVGAERGFVTRRQAAARALKILRFLLARARRYHGAFSHWIDGRTGRTIPFGRMDDGGDIVETSYVAQGLLFLREYFDRDDPQEAEVRRLADRIWREIEWDWYARREGSRSFLLWHWSPRYGWAKHLVVAGFNECLITYVLALASPTHRVSIDCYRTGWEHRGFARRRKVFGIPVELHRGIGPPMFFFHYSFLGLDPRRISYDGRSYFDHFRDLCRVQILYARSMKDRFAGYGPMWGLTACMGPDGYAARAPGRRDDGTIAPTAAVSSMPYVPAESFACMKTMYERLGGRIWDEFGFRDAFNLSRDWFARGVLGLDVGPIAPMIENYRTGMCWRTFMKAPEVRAALERIAREGSPASRPAGR
ncbi:MAG: beta-glucosidase [Planctomycetes bacterium]|nr:beta-glucosidase [Planctomycetota bacterium]